MLRNKKVSSIIIFKNVIKIYKDNYMYSLLAIAVGICIGCSPLGNSRMLKVIIMALTGG